MHTKPNELSKRERELIAVCVSRTNLCNYCIIHHQTGLARIIGDENIAEEISRASVNDIVSDHLTDRERAFCDYALKLTISPGKMEKNELTLLRDAGLSDAGILNLNQIVAYFAYANRTVSGLGTDTTGDVLGLHPSENTEGFGHS